METSKRLEQLEKDKKSAEIVRDFFKLKKDFEENKDAYSTCIQIFLDKVFQECKDNFKTRING